ncbi:ABATE domain-containing protein [Spongiactinospora sp. TRM90649]|uniref:CGNR zinc finger domain-containing protein n=1 Tax=Spongiactinospora sp. TRM90649 TaxID=3031114 RepID=UPI0023F70940|nr:ABATE domain-containing protein [Spongiactinospora sp. TRM90649]MDF5759327.1 ABATE domain-containing protein [Spongiactinospora sp. TRM90649]
MSVPMLGEPLPVELANTSYAVRGRAREGLATTGDLDAWLETVRPRFPRSDPFPAASEEDLTSARDLRDTIRALVRSAVGGERPAPAVVEALNAHVRGAARWKELTWDGDAPAVRACGTGPAVALALAAIAEQAVELFTGPRLADLRACHAPGCVLFFVKDHHRREWCSAGCGNRARAARHYEQVRDR